MINTLINPVSKVKNLGVIFDTHLNFDKHISSIVSKCHFHLRNLYVIRKFLDHQSLLTLVNSFILTHIDYCNVLLHGIPKKYLKKLQSVMNRAARLVFFLQPRDNAIPYLIQLHWLPILARIEFKICLITYKVLTTNKPEYLANLLKPAYSNSELSLRSSADPHRLFEPLNIQHKSFNDWSFAFSAPRLYNKLPIEIKSTNSVMTFKSHLKTYLFTKSYDCNNLTLMPDYKL